MTLSNLIAARAINRISEHVIEALKHGCEKEASDGQTEHLETWVEDVGFEKGPHFPGGENRIPNRIANRSDEGGHLKYRQ